MAVWSILAGGVLLLSALLWFWKLVRRIQCNLLQTQQLLQVKRNELEAKDSELETKEVHIQRQNRAYSKLKTEKSMVEAKLQKKLKAAIEKKKHLLKYRQMKKDNRSVKQQAEDIVGKGPKWLPHSCQEPRSHTIGKPKGAKGGGRKRPEKIHQTKELVPIICPGCHTSLVDKKTYFVYDKVLTELFREQDEVDAYQVTRVRNIRHNIYRRKCPNCKHWVYPEQGLFKNARFGVGLIAYVMTKRIRLSMTYECILKDLDEQFGLEFSLSVTTIIDWFYRFEEQIREVYGQLELLLKQEAFAHIDESGLPMQGKNWWLWIICTANLVLYRQSDTRSHKAITDIIEGFEGTIIADFFRAYEKFDGNKQQKCLAHLLSAIIELIVDRQKENERIERKLKSHEASIQRENQDAVLEQEGGKKTRGRKPKSDKLTANQISLLKARQTEILKTITQATAFGSFFRAPFQDSCFSWKKPVDERISVEDAQALLTGLITSIREEGVTDEDLERLLGRCEKFLPSLFTYLQQEGMPPDNNLAERNLRKFAKQRRASQDFKSIEVTKHLMEYLSLYMTCEVNGRDFHVLLQDLLSGNSLDLREFLFGIA